MSTQPSPRSPYRDRRINVMLQESQAAPVPDTPADRPTRRTEPAPKGSAGSRSGLSVKSRLSKNTLLAIAAATILVFAGLVFLLLSKGGGSEAVNGVPSQPVRAERSVVPGPVITKQPEAAAPAKSTADAVVAKEGAGNTADTVVPEQIRFRLRRGAKAQAIGALVMRLVSSNPKKHTCTLAMEAPNGRPMQKVLLPDHPFDLKLEDGQSVRVLISSIDKNAVSGTVTQPE